MSATDAHEGFWPNIAPPPEQRAALQPGQHPMALEAAPTIAELEAGSAPQEAPAIESPAGPEDVIDSEVPAIADEDPSPELAAPAAGPIALGAPEPDAPAEAEPIAGPIAGPIALGAPEAAVAAPDDHLPAPTLLVSPGPEATHDAAVDLAAELDDEQRLALEDVIDLGEFGSDPVDADIDSAYLDDLPVHEPPTLGGGNLEAARAAHPRTLAAHRELEAAVMEGTETLTEFDRSLIGLVVAIENRSGYWQIHLRHRLEQWRSPEHVEALATDWTATDLAVRERAMLAFAVKLTLVPGQMTQSDADLLGNVGFNERDLLDIVDVIAYWGFATRVAEGLGVFVEPWATTSPDPA